jgi:toxin ParE1/3/4
MATYNLSSLAEADLEEIEVYTLQNWGVDQAIHYIKNLRSHCQMLADNPSLGRACNHIRMDLHRQECERHVIYYLIKQTEIHIVRILHDRMLPERYLTND